MCGRYAFSVRKIGKWGSILVGRTEDFDDRFNIPPTSTVPVYVSDGWKMMRWGLIPGWSKESTTKYATFNARAESLIEKPAYRTAWKHGQRCLVPALGYYEWKQEGNRKTPFFIKSVLPEPLVFAGIWDKWQTDEKETYSFSIVTCEADGMLKDIHNRMPMMLVPDTANQWLTGNIDDAQGILHSAILHTANAVDVQFYPVDPMIGNTRNQGQALINPYREERESK